MKIETLVKKYDSFQPLTKNETIEVISHKIKTNTLKTKFDKTLAKDLKNLGYISEKGSIL